MQKIVTYTSYLILGITAVGALIGAATDMASIFSIKLALLLTTIIIIFWLALEIYAKFKGIKWRYKDQNTLIRKIEIKYRLAIIGSLILIWSPLLVLNNPNVSDPNINLLKLNQSRDYVNSILGIPQYSQSSSDTTTLTYRQESTFITCSFIKNKLVIYHIGIAFDEKNKLFVESIHWTWPDVTLNKTTLQEAIKEDKSAYDNASGRRELVGKPEVFSSSNRFNAYYSSCQTGSSRDNTERCCVAFIARNPEIFNEVEFWNAKNTYVNEIVIASDSKLLKYYLQFDGELIFPNK